MNLLKSYFPEHTLNIFPAIPNFFLIQQTYFCLDLYHIYILRLKSLTQKQHNKFLIEDSSRY